MRWRVRKRKRRRRKRRRRSDMSEAGVKSMREVEEE
jgi:hypothetical protein